MNFYIFETLSGFLTSTLSNYSSKSFHSTSCLILLQLFATSWCFLFSEELHHILDKIKYMENFQSDKRNILYRYTYIIKLMHALTVED